MPQKLIQHSLGFSRETRMDSIMRSSKSIMFSTRTKNQHVSNLLDFERKKIDDTEHLVLIRSNRNISNERQSLSKMIALQKIYQRHSFEKYDPVLHPQKRNRLCHLDARDLMKLWFKGKSVKIEKTESDIQSLTDSRPPSSSIFRRMRMASGRSRKLSSVSGEGIRGKLITETIEEEPKDDVDSLLGDDKEEIVYRLDDTALHHVPIVNAELVTEQHQDKHINETNQKQSTQEDKHIKPTSVNLPNSNTESTTSQLDVNKPDQEVNNQIDNQRDSQTKNPPIMVPEQERHINNSCGDLNKSNPSVKLGTPSVSEIAESSEVSKDIHHKNNSHTANDSDMSEIKQPSQVAKRNEDEEIKHIKNDEENLNLQHQKKICSAETAIHKQNNENKLVIENGLIKSGVSESQIDETKNETMATTFTINDNSANKEKKNISDGLSQLSNKSEKLTNIENEKKIAVKRKNEVSDKSNPIARIKSNTSSMSRTTNKSKSTNGVEMKENGKTVDTSKRGTLSDKNATKLTSVSRSGHEANTNKEVANKSGSISDKFVKVVSEPKTENRSSSDKINNTSARRLLVSRERTNLSNLSSHSNMSKPTSVRTSFRESESVSIVGGTKTARSSQFKKHNFDLPQTTVPPTTAPSILKRGKTETDSWLSASKTPYGTRRSSSASTLKIDQSIIKNAATNNPTNWKGLINKLRGHHTETIVDDRVVAAKSTRRLKRREKTFVLSRERTIFPGECKSTYEMRRFIDREVTDLMFSLSPKGRRQSQIELLKERESLRLPIFVNQSKTTSAILRDFRKFRDGERTLTAP